MATIIAASIDLSKIDKTKIVEGKNGGKYFNITIAVNDESRYGNNVSISTGQSKEEREAKEAKTYLGNGKVVWTDHTVTIARKEEESATSAPTTVLEDDLF